MRAATLPDKYRSQVRACAVVMQEAAQVLDLTGDEVFQQLGWELRRLTVRMYQLVPQASGGETEEFNRDLKRRIEAAVPVQGVAGVHAVTKSERYLLGAEADDDYSPGLLSSQFLEADEMSRSHL